MICLQKIKKRTNGRLNHLNSINNIEKFLFKKTFTNLNKK